MLLHQLVKFLRINDSETWQNICRTAAAHYMNTTRWNHSKIKVWILLKEDHSK